VNKLFENLLLSMTFRIHLRTCKSDPGELGFDIF
jgi:hypothetical protein